MLILTLIGLGYTWQQLLATICPAVAAPGNHPDVYITRLRLMHTNNKGQPDYELKAPLAAHSLSNNTIVLTHPVFTLFLDRSEHWQLSARHGRLRPKQQRLQLWQDVTLKQYLPVSKQVGAVFNTSLLNIDCKAQTATTPKRICMYQANHIITGIGMRADFMTKTIQLLSNVHAQLY